MSYKGSDGKVQHISEIQPRDGGITVTKVNGQSRHFTDLVAYVEAMRRQKIIDRPLDAVLALEDKSEGTAYGLTPDYDPTN